MNMKKSLAALSLSFLVLISQTGCGGGSAPSAGSAVSGSETASGAATPATGETSSTADAAATAGTAATGAPASTIGPAPTGGITPVGQTVSTGGGATPGASATVGVAQLSWDAAPAGISGYKVYYGASPRSYSSSVNVGNVPTYTVSLPGGTYYFTVTAYDSFGNESVYSNEVSKTI